MDVQEAADRADEAATVFEEEMTEALSQLNQERERFVETAHDQRTSIEEKSLQATKEITKDVALFRADTEAMRNDAVSQVIAALAPEFEQHNTALKQGIEVVAAESERTIKTFAEGKLEPLETTITGLKTRTDEITRDLNDAERPRIRLLALIGDLDDFNEKMETAQTTATEVVNAIHLRNEDARQALEIAQGIEADAKAQKQRIDEASTTARAAASQVDTLLKEAPKAAEKLPTIWAQLGGIAGQVAALGDRPEALHSHVANLESEADRLAGEMEPLSASIDTLAKDVIEATELLTSIKAKLQQLQDEFAETEPDVPEPQIAEGDLTRAEWRAIQRSLASLGYEPGPLDGIPGEQTRGAIRRFQAGGGAPATGQLSPQEIEVLLP